MHKQQWKQSLHNDGTEEDIITLNPQDFNFNRDIHQAEQEENDVDLEFGHDLDTRYAQMCSDLRKLIVQFSQVEQILAELVMQNKSKHNVC